MGTGESSMTGWISDAVIYQVNWRAVASREPRNAFEALGEPVNVTSSIAYVCVNLEALLDLGVNLLYLMPFYPSGKVGVKGIGSPYAIRDFTAVAPEHGSLDELGELVKCAHAVGMRVIIDITPNHTSRDNVWVAAHPEYYVTSDSGEFYYDFDWSDTAKLNYNCAGLREAMRGVFEYWLGFCGGDGVDGFRLDMAHMINDRSFWNDVISALRDEWPARELLFLAECYGIDNNHDLFTRGINAAYDDDFYKVCQYGYALDSDAHSHVRLSHDAEGNSEFADTLDAFRRGGIAGAMEHVLLAYETRSAGAGQGPWLARYTDNHDEGRGLYRFGRGATRAVMQLVSMAPHTLPFILGGQEFGAINRPSIHCRMGTCDKGPRIICGDTTVDDPGIEFEGNLFARSAAERREWYEFYRELMAVRLSRPELRQGDFSLLDAGESCAPSERSVIAFARSNRGRSLHCAVNLGSEPRKLGNSTLFEGKLLYGGIADGCLAPFSAVLTVS